MCCYINCTFNSCMIIIILPVPWVVCTSVGKFLFYFINTGCAFRSKELFKSPWRCEWCWLSNFKLFVSILNLLQSLVTFAWTMKYLHWFASSIKNLLSPLERTGGLREPEISDQISTMSTVCSLCYMLNGKIFLLVESVSVNCAVLPFSVRRIVTLKFTAVIKINLSVHVYLVITHIKFIKIDRV